MRRPLSCARGEKDLSGEKSRENTSGPEVPFTKKKGGNRAWGAPQNRAWHSERGDVYW